MIYMHDPVMLLTYSVGILKAEASQSQSELRLNLIGTLSIKLV